MVPIKVNPPAKFEDLTEMTNVDSESLASLLTICDHRKDPVYNQMLPDIKSELENIKLVKGNIDLSGKRTPL